MRTLQCIFSLESYFGITSLINIETEREPSRANPKWRRKNAGFVLKFKGKLEQFQVKMGKAVYLKQEKWTTDEIRIT